jgi:hypothetical protein
MRQPLYRRSMPPKRAISRQTWAGRSLRRYSFSDDYAIFGNYQSVVTPFNVRSSKASISSIVTSVPAPNTTRPVAVSTNS